MTNRQKRGDSMVEVILSRRALVIGLGCVGLMLHIAVLAGDLRVMELVDGSRITGEVVLFEHGVYTIESESLGRLHLPSSDIRAIRSTQTESAPRAASSFGDEDPPSAIGLTHYRSQILADPAILTMVMALQNDPDVRAVLNDPSIMQAIANRDYVALQKNPKILKLENNPAIRKILDAVGSQ